MAEVLGEASYVPHHPKKIALIFAAMRKFATRLEGQGWRVAYTRLDDSENTQTIPGELIRRAAETGAVEVIATEPGEFRLIAALEDCPIPSLLHHVNENRTDGYPTGWSYSIPLTQSMHGDCPKLALGATICLVGNTKGCLDSMLRHLQSQKESAQYMVRQSQSGHGKYCG